MAGRHRGVGERTARVAMVTAATATATAMTIGAAAPAPMVDRVDERSLRTVDQRVDLTAAVSPFGPPGSLPDVTGGAGQTANQAFQAFIEAYERALVSGVGIAGGLGINIEDLLGAIPLTFIDDILGAIPINLGTVLDPVLGDLLTPALINLLSALGITDGAGNITLSAVLGLVGLDLSDPLNLAGLDIPGVNIVTPGAPFALLKILAGLDLGWTPTTANAVADAINQTPYLSVDVENLLDIVLDLADEAVDDLPLVGPLLNIVTNLLDTVTPDLGLDIVDVRIPITIGYGFGAMAAGQAYQQAVADLANQPHFGAGGPVLGSLTILPMILANNVGRANGGMLARFYPLFDLLGIDVITPETATTSSGVGIPVLGTGIELGAANLIPIKIDATIQYQPYSDLAAWPNPVSLFNNLLAGTIGASYIMRGVEVDTAVDQVLTEVGETIADALDLGNPLAVNMYLTLGTATLPLLEPLYLLGDALNMVSFGTLGTIPYRLANALAPALTSLVNLGYTDVVRNPDGTYTRTLDDADTATPFMSFPDVDWGQAAGDVMNSLVNGFHKEFFSGNPTPAPPNVLENLGKLIGTLTGGLDLSGLTDGLQQGLDNLVSGLTDQAESVTGPSIDALRTAEPAPAGKVPDPTAKLVTLSADSDDETPAGKHAKAPGTEIPADSGLPPKHAADEEEELKSDEQPELEDEEQSEEEDTAGEETGEESEGQSEDDIEDIEDLDDLDDLDDIDDLDGTDGTDDIGGTEKPDTTTKKPTVRHNPLNDLVRNVQKAFSPPKKKKKKAGAATETESGTDKDSSKNETSAGDKAA